METGFSEAEGECLTVFDEVADQVVTSLTPNEDTTIESEMETEE